MPQITLRLSDNIIITQDQAKALLKDLQNVLIQNKDELKLNIDRCFSAIIKENVSYIGEGNTHVAKCYYELLWIETPARKALIVKLAKNLMEVLDHFAAKLSVEQQLSCSPNIRIAHLGTPQQDYFFSERV